MRRLAMAQSQGRQPYTCVDVDNALRRPYYTLCRFTDKKTNHRKNIHATRRPQTASGVRHTLREADLAQDDQTVAKSRAKGGAAYSPSLSLSHPEDKQEDQQQVSDPPLDQEGQKAPSSGKSKLFTQASAVRLNKKTIAVIRQPIFHLKGFKLEFKGMDEMSRLEAVLHSFSPARLHDWLRTKQALFTGGSSLPSSLRSQKATAPSLKKSDVRKQVCQQFIRDGKCHWGSLCLFSHPERNPRCVQPKRTEEKMPLKHLYKDVHASVVWEHGYVRAENEFIAAMDMDSVNASGNPWGLSGAEVIRFVSNGDGIGLLERLGLGGHITSGVDVLHNPDVNMDELFGQPHSTQLYSKIVALCMFFKIVMALDNSHSHILRDCLRTMMRQFCGGSILLSRMWAVPTVWWDLKDTASCLLTALRD
jgi:hypothetical protein